MLSGQLLNFAILAQNCLCQYVNKWVWPLHSIKPYLQNQVMGQSWPAGYSLPTSAIAKQIRCKQKKLFELDAMEKAVNYRAVLYRANLKWGQHSKGQIWTSTPAPGPWYSFSQTACSQLLVEPTRSTHCHCAGRAQGQAQRGCPGNICGISSGSILMSNLNAEHRN